MGEQTDNQAVIVLSAFHRLARSPRLLCAFWNTPISITDIWHLFVFYFLWRLKGKEEKGGDEVASDIFALEIICKQKHGFFPVRRERFLGLRHFVVLDNKELQRWRTIELSYWFRTYLYVSNQDMIVKKTIRESEKKIFCHWDPIIRKSWSILNSFVKKTKWRLERKIRAQDAKRF